MKMKLYKVNKYDKYSANEVSVEWVTCNPIETVYYKYEILYEVEIELPEGVTYKDILILFNNKNCVMVNKKDSTVCVVSSSLIINWF